MIRIGDFARLGQVSVATLRHYDELGLLKPSSVDAFTGYRYYSAAQLPRLNRILALKDLGFSLDQIERALADSLSPDQLRGMLMVRRAEAEHRLADEQARLARIEARLRHIELENMMPASDVVLKNLPAVLVAARRVTIPTNDQVPAYLDPAIMETYEFVRNSGARDTGPCLAIWHQAAEVLENEVAEAAVPIDRAVPSSERVQVYELPGTQVAAVVHSGPFEDFTQEHTTVLNWIEANGFRVAGPYREVYIRHDPHDMSNSATEIQYPVEKA